MVNRLEKPDYSREERSDEDYFPDFKNKTKIRHNDVELQDIVNVRAFEYQPQLFACINAELQVLNEIQTVPPTLPFFPQTFADLIAQEIVRNISNKFQGVRREVRTGRDRILREAASDLNSMRGGW